MNAPTSYSCTSETFNSKRSSNFAFCCSPVFIISGGDAYLLPTCLYSTQVPKLPKRIHQGCFASICIVQGRRSAGKYWVNYLNPWKLNPGPLICTSASKLSVILNYRGVSKESTTAIGSITHLNRLWTYVFHFWADNLFFGNTF